MAAPRILREIEGPVIVDRAGAGNAGHGDDIDRRMNPDELGELARRMVEAADPAAADALQEALIRGFYGGANRIFAPA